MKTVNFLLLFFLILLGSCKDKNPEADCGCNSPAVRTIENTKASYSGSHALFLRLSNANGTEYDELYQLCTKPDTLTITPNNKNPDYMVSGKIKNSCFLGPTFMIQSQLFEITEIKKIL